MFCARLRNGQLLTTPPRDSAPRRSDRIVLMVCDPNSLYAYWETAADPSQGGNEDPTDWVMRLHDVTPDGPPDLNLRDFVDYQCEAGATDGVLGEVIPGRTYRVDLGHRPREQDFVCVAASNEVQTPPSAPSDWVEDHFVTVQWAQDLEGFEPPPTLDRPPPEPVYDPGDWAAIPRQSAAEENQSAEPAPTRPDAAAGRPAPASTREDNLPADDSVCQQGPAANDSGIEPTTWRGNDTVLWAAGSIPGAPPLDSALDSAPARQERVTAQREATSAAWDSVVSEAAEQRPEGPTIGVTEPWVPSDVAMVHVDGTSQIRRRRADQPLRTVCRLPFRGTFEGGNPPSSVTHAREHPPKAKASEAFVGSSITADQSRATWCSPAIPACDESPGDGHSVQ